jgi:hypothetical protein
MILSILKNFKCCQVGFVQAFTQAPLECPIYMEIPAGYSIIDGKLQFSGETHCNTDKSFVLKLLKNMYALKQAGYNWYNIDKLLQAGFTQSAVDKCLFIHHDCIIIVYVDDCLLFSPSDTVLDGMIELLNQLFKITSSNSIEAYLGLEVTRSVDNSITLCQTGLIDKVIQLCGLEAKSNKHLPPADKILLDSDAV